MASADLSCSTKMVLDRTWLVHLPKLVMWLACEANLAFLIWHLYQPDLTAVLTGEDSGCHSPSWQQTSSTLIAVRARCSRYLCKCWANMKTASGLQLDQL